MTPLGRWLGLYLPASLVPYAVCMVYAVTLLAIAALATYGGGTPVVYLDLKR